MLLEKILASRNSASEHNYYELLDYTLPQLKAVLKHVQSKDGKYKTLIKYLEREIRLRDHTSSGGKLDAIGVTWFTDMWYSVQSLFAKGPYNLTDDKTQQCLGAIKHEWCFNNDQKY